MSNEAGSTNLPRRSQAQHIGDTGQALVEYMIAKAGNWIRRPVGADFGVDLEMELTHEGSVTGAIVKTQIKTTHSIETRDGHVHVSVPVSLLAYAEAMRVPFMLVIVDLKSEQCWFSWLQKLVFELRESNTFPATQETLTLRIPQTDTLLRGLSEEIPRIASFNTEVQLALSLVDLVRASTALSRTDVVVPLAALLKSLSSAYSAGHVAQLIQGLIDAGNVPWLSEHGRGKMELLFALAREAGELFNADQIVALVLRGETYSRTGLNILGVLYSYQWEHAKALNLAPIFKATGFAEIAYYCKLRERYHVQLSADLVTSEVDTRIDGYELRFERFDLNRWANRGESEILECVAPVAQ